MVVSSRDQAGGHDRDVPAQLSPSLSAAITLTTIGSIAFAGV
jgi:hypothetical protein